MKVSIVIPVYYNEENLIPLYNDIKEKFIDRISYEYELIMVNDGSKDGSLEVIRQLAEQDSNIKVVSLSRNIIFMKLLDLQSIKSSCRQGLILTNQYSQ